MFFPLVSAIEVFRGTYGSNASEHFRFGFEVGQRFKSSIAARLAVSSTSVPAAWIAHHTARYPLYIAEIRGMAAGANTTFESMMALNLQEELATPDHCSDVIVPGVCLAHNEDGSAADFGHTFIAQVTIDGSSWGAYVYAGQLASGAFAWKREFAFSLNYVQPAIYDPSGFGRGFVSRDLLKVNTPREAIEVARDTKMISGHNYQFVVWGEEIVNVEAAAFEHGVVTVPTAPFFHANEYDSLVVDQVVGESTLRRTVRATKQLPPAKTPMAALDVLSDIRDVDGSGNYPIYRKDSTLATALFDLNNASVTVFQGPANNLNIIYGPIFI